MTYIINYKKVIAILAIIFLAGFFAFSFSTSSVEAWGSGCGDCDDPTPPGDDDDDDDDIIPAECISFTATPKNLPAGGGNVTLAWNTTSGSNTPHNIVSIDNGVGAVGKFGSKTVAVSKTTTYTLTVTGLTSRDTCSVTVVVPTTPPAVCDSFSATPVSIVKGQSAVLAWNTTNATAVSINHGVGSVAVDGSKSVRPNQTTTYTLTAVGTNGNDSCVTKVTVTNPPVVKTCDITASLDTVNFGGSVTLTWKTTGYASVAINGVAVAANGSKTYTNIQSDTTYTLTAESVNSEDRCTTNVIVKCVPPSVPVCTLKANPITITAGNSATLTWTSHNATTRTIDQGIGSVPVSGSKVVSPGVTTTYTMTVKNVAGVKKTCAVVVKVNPAPLAPTCDSFLANPTVINRGSNSTLTWATTRANKVTINNGVGSVTVDGSLTVSPINTTTYTLTAVGTGGTVTCPVTVTVKEPVDQVPVCKSFTASPTKLPYGGGNVTLTWSTARANEVSINQGIGKVALNGSRLVTISQTKNFTLTATDKDGDRVTCAVKVLVEPKHDNPITCENNVSFSANPRIIREGEDSWLTWSTTGITNVRFEGIGDTSLSGSARVSPRSDTTYTLIANDSKNTIHCPITIAVDRNTGGGGGGTPSPRCELSISNKNISAGERVTLKWKTSSATSVFLKDNYGNTLITTDGVSSSKKKELYDGEITVRPEKDTTYTLTAERGSRDRHCTVKVDVDDKIVVLEVRDQLPLITGIKLTEVPYTGFEAGPTLTLIFYTLLVLWAVYLAYVLVIRKNNGLASAYAGVDNGEVEEIITATAQDANPGLFVDTKASPVFTTMAATLAPVKESVQIGYGSVVASNDEATEIENQAHASQVLLSSDAMRYFMTTTEGMDRSEVLSAVIEEAKASYPSEDGWVVLNEERLVKTCDTCVAELAAPSNEAPFIPATLPIGNSSLAEAIISGNIVAAYQMIGNRPMIALADAAADLDALYRAKQGVEVAVSELLVKVGAEVAVEKLHLAISALTSALDGVYTNEAEAVKMAIMKATKALND